MATGGDAGEGDGFDRLTGQLDVEVPNSWTMSGGQWPAGAFRLGTPVGVLAAARVCVVVSALCTLMNWSTSQFATAVAFDLGEVSSVLEGESLPTVHFLAAVVQRTGIDVWPSPEVVQALLARTRR